MRVIPASQHLPALAAWLTAAWLCQPVWAAEAQPFEGSFRGALYGMGRGIAAGAIATGRPASVQTAAAPLSGVIRTYRVRGLKVAVLMVDSGRSGLPLSVEIRGPDAIRRMAKELSELTPDAVRMHHGVPTRESPGVLFYAGLSEACEDGVELRFSGERLMGATWTFCVD